MKIKEPLEIYIHIPFCIKKCNYCDFLSFSCDEDEKSQYVDALLTQIRTVGSGLVPGCDVDDPDFEEREDKFKVSTVYIGGGTPTTLNEEQIGQILCQLKESFELLDDCEITVEANPGTVTLQKLETMKKHGVNRISLGLQSVNENELKLLGRIHDYDTFVESYVNCREAGFDNVNVDIMTALPEQTEASLKRTLESVLALEPEHISAYSLIIEEDTPFYEAYGDLEGPVAGEEMERKLYYLARDILSSKGYKQYEISNFAKPGYESRHNSGYWKRENYFGLGLGASSFFDAYRVTNTEDYMEYIKNPSAFSSCNRISENDAMEEFMYLGLRMMNGICPDDFYKSFHRDFYDVYGKTVEKLVKDSLIEEKNGRIYLTEKGVDYGNFVFSQFLL